MEARLAPEVEVKVFEGELEECQKKVNEWLISPENKMRQILNISVAHPRAILIVYTRVGRLDRIGYG